MIPDAVMHELRYIEVATARKMRTPRVGPFTSRLRGDGFFRAVYAGLVVIGGVLIVQAFRT